MGIFANYVSEQILGIWATVIYCAVAAIAFIGLAAFFSGQHRGTWQQRSEFAQGLGAAVTIFALFIAAGLYLVERKDKAKLRLDVSAARALIPTRGAGPARVLLGIRVLITNNSDRQIVMRCAAVDVLQPSRQAALARAGASEDMQLDPISPPIGYRNPDDSACLYADARRRSRSHPVPVRPLFMWDTLLLEPNEADDLYLEVPVGCDSPFVRVLVKLRINPDDRYGYETKAIIPLDEICARRASGMAETVIARGEMSGDSEMADQAEAAK